MGRSVIKELFILALLTMVILFTLGIVLYEYIPSNKAVPQPIEYTADSAVTSTLQEIAATIDYSYSDDDSTSDTGSLLKSYSIGTSDLKSYASKKAYESGKTDPFSEYVEETNEDENTTSENTTTNTATSGKTTSTNSSTGTFFESSSSK